MATKTQGKGGSGHGSKHGGHLDTEDRASKLPKKAYEKELRRLQEELVKMEDWVSQSGARIVVIFEGRDAAGKGGDDQADHAVHEPARHPHRGAPQAHRARTLPVVLPAVRREPALRRRDRPVRPELVQPRRRREGARLLHAGRAPAVPPAGPDLRAAPGRGRDRPAQVLVLRVGRGTGTPVPLAHRRPDAPLEAVRDGPALPIALGRFLAREGRDVRPHRHLGGALVRGGGRRQAAGAA